MKQISTLRAIFFATIIAVATAVAPVADAAGFNNETLTYKVLYKWGLVHKTAGRATLSLHTTPSTYNATLVARSEPWADGIYKLRDTLRSTMQRTTLRPTLYEKIAHEDGKYSRDVVRFSYSGNVATGNCIRYRRKKQGDPVKTATTTLTANGTVVDMLSVFYHLRTLDFNTMQQGRSKAITIFSGKRKETLTITYHGTKNLKVGKTQQPTYYLTFTFSSGGKKSSDPISVWISADSRRIPLRLEGSLKIGKIICEYTGK